MQTPDKQNLLGFTRQELEDLFRELGEKPFRATQVLKWIHHQGVTDFGAMTNLSKVLRQRLAEVAEVRAPEVVTDQASADGSHKWVLRLDDGQHVETVYIPDGQRGTLCVSSQVGCALECSFCSTARQGFNRNLSAAEIIGQVWRAYHELGSDQSGNRLVTNVVLMGMGEPLLNFDEVVKATELMQDDLGYGISKRRVTLSTAGVVPALDRLAGVTDISLAVSLHAPNDELRNELVPLNRKYPIRDLIESCKRYVQGQPARRVTFEYVMLAGVNDSDEHARQLVKLLRGVPAKVNLIPFNPFPESRYRRSSREVVDRFRDILMAHGLMTITRKTRGDDIDAACGQLVGKVVDRTKRAQRRAGQAR